MSYKYRYLVKFGGKGKEKYPGEKVSVQQWKDYVDIIKPGRAYLNEIIRGFGFRDMLLSEWMSLIMRNGNLKGMVASAAMGYPDKFIQRMSWFESVAFIQFTSYQNRTL